MASSSDVEARSSVAAENPLQPVGVDAAFHESRCDVPAVTHAVLVEPVADRLFQVSGLDRAQVLRRRLDHLVGDFLLQRSRELEGTVQE